MDAPKISVIVPIYKAEKYLCKCIDSILAQTFTDFELLLIDDGSPDSSGKICDEYAEKDSRIHVFHKENGGVSSARNMGLDNAQGEWIAFVDADDYLFEGTISPHLFNNKMAMQCDIIEYPYDKENVMYRINTCKLHGRLFNKYYSKYFHNELWGRFYKRSIIGDVRFNKNLFIGEDVFFICQILCGCHSLFFYNEGGYFYNVNNDSVMRNADVSKINSQRYALLDNFIAEGMINNIQVLEFYFRQYFFVKNVDSEFNMYLKEKGIISLRNLFRTNFPVKTIIKYLINMI